MARDLDELSCRRSDHLSCGVAYQEDAPGRVLDEGVCRSCWGWGRHDSSDLYRIAVAGFRRRKAPDIGDCPDNRGFRYLRERGRFLCQRPDGRVLESEAAVSQGEESRDVDTALWSSDGQIIGEDDQTPGAVFKERGAICVRECTLYPHAMSRHRTCGRLQQCRDRLHRKGKWIGRAGLHHHDVGKARDQDLLPDHAAAQIEHRRGDATNPDPGIDWNLRSRDVDLCPDHSILCGHAQRQTLCVVEEERPNDALDFHSPIGIAGGRQVLRRNRLSHRKLRGQQISHARSDHDGRGFSRTRDAFDFDFPPWRRRRLGRRSDHQNRIGAHLHDQGSRRGVGVGRDATEPDGIATTGVPGFQVANLLDRGQKFTLSRAAARGEEGDSHEQRPRVRPTSRRAKSTIRAARPCCHAKRLHYARVHCHKQYCRQQDRQKQACAALKEPVRRADSTSCARTVNNLRLACQPKLTLMAKERIQKGRVLVVGAEYSLEAGVVDFFDGVPEAGY